MSFRNRRAVGRAAAVIAAISLAACSSDSGSGSGADAGTDSTGRDVTRPEDIGNVDVGGGDPQAPTAEAGEDMAATAGDLLTFDGSGSFDPDGEVVEWAWTMGNGVTLQGETVNYTYPTQGTFQVTLTVTDDDELTDSDTLTVDLAEPNDGPIAIIVGPREVVQGEENEWDARDSRDLDGSIVSYAWDTGVEDEELFEDDVLTYTYEDWGEFPMALTVTDDGGAENTVDRPVTVLAPPTAVIVAPDLAVEGEPVQFDATMSMDPDGNIVSYAWDYEDGTTGTGPLPTHTFTTPGSYDVTLLVTDNDDLIGEAIFKIEIDPGENALPSAVADAERETVMTYEDVNLTADGSLDTDGMIVEYFWDFGDGTDTFGQDVSHQYEDDGVYVVTLRLTDNEGGMAEDSVEITVENRAPNANFEWTANQLTVSFDGNISRDMPPLSPDGTVESWEWNFGDGVLEGPNNDGATSHSYSAAGTYDVTLMVTDDDGATAEYTERVVVMEAPATYSGRWLFEPAIDYQCAEFFGMYLVNVNFTGFNITDSAPSVAFSTWPNSQQPGSMNGSFAGMTEVSVINIISGGCTETYRFDGEFTDANTLVGTFRAEFSGSGGIGGGCGDCMNQMWDLTLTRE